jgi:hypothetical protein
VDFSMVLVATGFFGVAGLLVRAVPVVRAGGLSYVRALLAVYELCVRVVPGVDLLAADTEALYASFSRSSRSRRSTASTHSTTEEVDVERSL